MPGRIAVVSCDNHEDMTRTMAPANAFSLPCRFLLCSVLESFVSTVRTPLKAPFSAV